MTRFKGCQGGSLGCRGGNLRWLASEQTSKLAKCPSLNHPPGGQAEVSLSLPLGMFPFYVYIYLHLTYIESTDLSQKTLGHPLDIPPRTIPPDILSYVDNCSAYISTALFYWLADQC